jgi:hypothetical protein
MHKLLIVYFLILLHTQSFNIKNSKSGYLLHTRLYSKKNKNTTPKYGYVYVNEYEELDIVIENRIKALNLKKNLVLSHKNKYIKEKDIFKYFENNIDNYEKKKLIILSPGGINGFYMLGVCSYIKENYNLTNYIFSGASAGAWNALYMIGDNNTNFKKLIFSINFEEISSIMELQFAIKSKILESVNYVNYDYNRLFIGVTAMQGLNLVTNIYTQFVDLKDALDCCIASSHIPFITGGFVNKYHNITTFDGGFGKNPYINISEPVLHIHAGMWNNEEIKGLDSLRYKKNKQLFIELFEKGYNDTRENKDYLDKVLL